MNCSVMMGSRCRDTVRKSRRGETSVGYVETIYLYRGPHSITMLGGGKEKEMRGGRHVACDNGNVTIVVTNRLVVPGDVSRSKNGTEKDQARAFSWHNVQ